MGEVDNTGGVSRRTVTKAMAWAVPAVAVAATVPGAAASCVPVIVIDPGQSCKTANVNNYKLVFKFSADCTPEACEGQIIRIQAKTGGNPELWPNPAKCPNGSQPTATPTVAPHPMTSPIYLCDACNMASSVIVTWTAPCVSGTQVTEVSMPQWNNAASTCSSPITCG